eukprot:TRINITY_DN5066_c0_g1_i2.p3 TRINITY_DN5066_c0_g1~~TRINITY_DN5066_c0_g1_i2.p3  ORF type:complete len:155 (-),score=30.05 TRINITY_DN5066_c0_g1_i2:126-590(-)
MSLGSTEALASAAPNESVFPSMSFRTRMIGFCICVGVGIFLQIIGLIMVGTLKFGTFAICNTLGIVLMVGASVFLMGPMKQLKRMFTKERLPATVILLAGIVLTLVMGLAVKSTILTIIFAALTWVAYLWYILSYIPFAQKCVKNCISSCTGGS